MAIGQRTAKGQMMFRRLYDWTLRWSASRYAEVAMATVSFVESSVFPVPAEVLFVPMVLSRPDRAMRYALIATVASVLGGIAGWMIGFYGFDVIARPILEFYGKVDEFDALKAKTGDGAILVMLVTSGLAHLPPMKVVTILSGVIAFDLKLFILSAIVARGAKFFALAWALRRYGPSIVEVIERRFAMVAIAIVVVLGFAWVWLKYL
jgi:membrane protein YqaA with SNARE-associated domain